MKILRRFFNRPTTDTTAPVMTVTPGGEKEWHNKNGLLHREDGPAIERPDTYGGAFKAWYRNGKQHREDGPAYEGADGTRAWYRNGLLHREDGPAVERGDGRKEWWQNGKLIVKVPAVSFAVEDQARQENRQRDIEGAASAIKTGTPQPIVVSRPLRLKPSRSFHSLIREA